MTMADENTELWSDEDAKCPDIDPTPPDGTQPEGTGDDHEPASHAKDETGLTEVTESPVGDPEGPQEDDGDASDVIEGGSPTYEDMRAQIASGDFKLEDMLNKLTRLYIEDIIKGNEYDELMQFARDNANPDKDIEQNTDIVKQLMAKVTALEQTAAAMDAHIKKLEDPESEPEEPAVTYEPYNPHKWYYKDMTCSFEGKNYVCIAPDGVVCTWSPKDYPNYWQEVKA